MFFMFTVNEVSKIAGISIRTLQYYDKIGLLPPSGFTDSGYRLYNEDSLERLQTILLFRELEFPLKEIKKIIENPDFDKEKALSEQIKLLKLRREQIDSLISLAEKLKNKEEKILDFTAFDKTKLKEPAVPMSIRPCVSPAQATPARPWQKPCPASCLRERSARPLPQAILPMAIRSVLPPVMLPKCTMRASLPSAWSAALWWQQPLLIMSAVSAPLPEM